MMSSVERSFAGNVSRETMERYSLLESLVKKWNPAINLVSKESVAHLYDRHIQDSAQLFYLANCTSGLWCDLGSGGGFPGLVIAILMKGEGVAANLTLVESDARKCAFLREAARQLDLDVAVLNHRIEELPPSQADYLSARALSSLTNLCAFADRHLAANGTAFFPKGERFAAEVEEAKRLWTFDLRVHPSITHPAAAILELKNIRHV